MGPWAGGAGSPRPPSLGLGCQETLDPSGVLGSLVWGTVSHGVQQREGPVGCRGLWAASGRMGPVGTGGTMGCRGACWCKGGTVDAGGAMRCKGAVGCRDACGCKGELWMQGGGGIWDAGGPVGARSNGCKGGGVDAGGGLWVQGGCGVQGENRVQRAACGVQRGSLVRCRGIQGRGYGCRGGP